MLDVEVETKSEKYPVIEKNTKVEITNGVSDPKSGRNRTKTVEERKNPIVTAKEKAHVDQGVVKYVIYNFPKLNFITTCLILVYF